MNYPEEFSREARARIVAAKTRADQQLILTRSGSEPVTTNSGRLAFVHVQSNWMAAVLGAFAHEACEIARSNIWSVDHVSELVQAYHTELAQIVKAKCDEVKHLSGGQIAGDWVDSTYAEILGWVELSQEWRQYQAELLSLAVVQSSANEKEATILCEQHPNPLESTGSTDQANAENEEVDAAEIERRATLLAEYKAANGNPSNRKIYSARNSNIHKPQFHEWLKGTLKKTSQTCKNFERFLREKKAPIPRKASQ